MNEKTDQTKEQDQQVILAVFRIKNKQGVEARHQLIFKDIDSIKAVYSLVNEFVRLISKENPFELCTLEIIPQSITDVDK